MNKLVHKQPSTIGSAALFSVLFLLCMPHAYALPEDANQPLEVAAGNAELFLDDGITVIHGTDAAPAIITKGTMKISGTQIRIESKNDEADKVTATGSPARYQQQLKADQEPIHASGLTLIFDNSAQTLVIDVDAELLQAGKRTTGHHFEYDLTTNRVNVSMDPDGEQIRMVIPPAVKQ